MYSEKRFFCSKAKMPEMMLDDALIRGNDKVLEGTSVVIPAQSLSSCRWGWESIQTQAKSFIFRI